MKSLIIFLLCCSVSIAQTTRVSPKRGGVPIPNTGDSSYVLTVVSSDTTVVPAWRAAAGGGSGTFENWSATDAGSPDQAPTVTAGTKGLAIGDSANNSGLSGIAIGNLASNTAIDGIAIGASLTNAFNNALNSGMYGIALGVEAQNRSYGSITIGYGAGDLSSSNVDANSGGGSIIIGETASSDSAFNTVIGYSATAQGGRSSTAIGDGANVNGNCNISLGSQSGISVSGAKSNRVLIYAQDLVLNGNRANQDSVTIINGNHLIAQNADEYLYGAHNIDGVYTDLLFQLSDGGRHGNASTFDVIRAHFNGNVEMGGTVTGADFKGVPYWVQGTLSSMTDARWFNPNGRNASGQASDPTDIAQGDFTAAWVAPEAITISKLYIQMNDTVGVNDTVTATIWKNGSATSVQALLTGSTDRSVTDNTHTLSCVEGDLISIKFHITANGTPNVFTLISKFKWVK